MPYTARRPDPAPEAPAPRRLPPEYLRRRPAPEHIGPSGTYRELEALLGYLHPTGYRSKPSTPADWQPGGGPRWTAGIG